MAEKIMPDVILLDIDLPDRPGFDIVDLGEVFNVIVISGKIEMTDEIARKMHALAFLKKPFAIEALEEAVNKVLDLNKAVTKEKLEKVLFSYGVMKAFHDEFKMQTGVSVPPKELESAIKEKLLK